jgi:hypothetical protein
VLGDDLHAAGGAHRPAGLDAAHAEVEERHAVVRAVHAEDLAQHAELEHRELVEDEDGDAPQHASSLLAESCRSLTSRLLLAGTSCGACFLP